jgi:hypothetical protein
MYLITFIKKKFHSHFTINLLKFINFFLVKQLTMQEGKKFPKIFLEKFAFYGLDMELEPETGSGTVTFQKKEPESEP